MYYQVVFFHLNDILSVHDIHVIELEKATKGDMSQVYMPQFYIITAGIPVRRIMDDIFYSCSCHRYKYDTYHDSFIAMLR